MSRRRKLGETHSSFFNRLKVVWIPGKRSFECSFSNGSTIGDLNFFFFFTFNAHKNRVFFGLMKPSDTPFSCKGAGRFPVHVAVNMGSLPLVPGKWLGYWPERLRLLNYVSPGLIFPDTRKSEFWGYKFSKHPGFSRCEFSQHLEIMTALYTTTEQRCSPSRTRSRNHRRPKLNIWTYVCCF